MKTVSIIIPVYNEERLIAQTIERVMSADSCGLTKEIIVVDDGSTDGTGDKIKKYKVIYLKNKTNKGKGYALKIGFKKATGDILMVQDADEEYSVSDYPQLLLPLLHGRCKVVYGSRNMKRKRFKNKYSYFIFYVGGLLLTWVINILFNLRLTDQPTGYKLFSKSVKYLLLRPGENKFSYEVAVTATLAKQNISIVEVPIHYKPRTLAEGKKISWLDFIKSVIVAVKYKLTN